MALRLKPDEKPGAGLRRVARKRLQKLLNTLSAREMLRDAVVHDARRQVKEFRGVLRVARAELGKKACRRENQALREAARPLSELRDATVLIDTLDKLIERSHGRLKPADLALLRRYLQERRQQVRSEVLRNKPLLAQLVGCLQGTERRVGQWPDGDGNWKAVRDGMRRIYRRARTAMRAALEKRSNEALHEWRKRTNALRCAIELLCCRAPKRSRRITQQAHRLTDILGEDHDLAMLGEVVQQQGVLQSEAAGAMVVSLLAKRRLALQQRAHGVGKRLFRDTGSRFVRQLFRQ
ncbi:MAG: CHAD domain-containing protein [Steroidobacteraceae bacterium]|jgi:CHAD domain-containing protein